MRHPRAWIIAVVGLIGAVVMGVIGASLVLPSDQPKSAASPAAIAISPRATPTPAVAVLPIAAPTPAPSTAPSEPPPRLRPRVAPPAVAPDPDPVIVTTTNSW